MKEVAFYRDPALPFLEVKVCRDKSMSYRKHFHEEYSIGVIDKGSSTVWCDGKDLDVEAGRFLWIPPYVPHACNPEESSGWSYRMLFIRPEWVERVRGCSTETTLRTPYLAGQEVSRKLKAEVNKLLHGLERGVSPLETETVLLTIIHTLQNADHAGTVAPDSDFRCRVNLDRARQFLHDHALDRVTMEQLEEVSGISRFHLIHRFKQEHHLPPHAYQNLLRFQYAKKELSKRRPIADVAVEAGFYDQSHFTKMFKGYAGVTPSQYIKSL